MANMKFGECLKLLLSILGISMNQLSKAINVDNSLVNRWIHEKRTPLYNTTYIERISEYSSKNVNNTFQVQHLNGLFTDICKNSSSEDSIKEKIIKILSEAQGYSIECKKNKQITNFADKDNFKSEFSDELLCDPSELIGLSSEDKIVTGSSNIFNASNHLLKAAASQNCRSNNTIYISLINDVNMADVQFSDLIHWREIIIEAIRNGWNVIFFIRLNNNIDRIIKLINLAKSLVKTGKFNPYYLKRYDIFSTGRENLCVPGVGALSCFSTKPLSGVDCAFYLKTKAAVDIIENYFKVLLATCAQPLFNYYQVNNSLEFYHNLVKNEESIGNRILYKYCFSILTIPRNLYIRILKRIGLSHHEMIISQECYEKRLKAFLVNIQNYEYKDIYFYESVIQLIKHKQFYFYYHMGVKLIDLEVEDIIEILHNIICLLKSYKNYNIAFTRQYTDSISTINEFYCVVKERQAVLLEIYEPTKSMPLVQLSIEEPMVVKAIEEYFAEKWEQIAPINKDKNEVIRWIQSQIELLENKICG